MLYKLTLEKFKDQSLGKSSPEICVGGLFFLRFICPCFVTPERYAIASVQEITSQARRNLILISKILQNLSNHLLFSKKEAFMIFCNNFLEVNQEKMKNLLKRLSHHFHEESASKFIDENQLYQLHCKFIEKNEFICAAVEKGSNTSTLLDKYTAVMDCLGDSKSPIELTNQKKNAKSWALAKFLLKRAASSVNLPLPAASSSLNYFCLFSFLIEKTFHFPLAISEAISSKELDFFTKFLLKLFHSYSPSLSLGFLHHCIFTEVSLSRSYLRLSSPSLLLFHQPSLSLLLSSSHQYSSLR